MGLMRLYSRLGTRNKTQGVETAGSHEDWRLATRPSQRGSRFLGHDLITINPGKSKIWLRRDAFRQTYAKWQHNENYNENRKNLVHMVCNLL
jgi:hypothetical protein